MHQVSANLGERHADLQKQITEHFAEVHLIHWGYAASKYILVGPAVLHARFSSLLRGLATHALKENTRGFTQSQIPLLKCGGL
jgi:hypothetical protein